MPDLAFAKYIDEPVVFGIRTSGYESPAWFSYVVLPRTGILRGKQYPPDHPIRKLRDA